MQQLCSCRALHTHADSIMARVCRQGCDKSTESHLPSLKVRHSTADSAPSRASTDFCSMQQQHQQTSSRQFAVKFPKLQKLWRVVQTNCVQSMLVELVLETTDAQKQNRSVVLLTGVGRNEEETQQTEREGKGKRGRTGGCGQTWSSVASFMRSRIPKFFSDPIPIPFTKPARPHADPRLCTQSL